MDDYVIQMKAVSKTFFRNSFRVDAFKNLNLQVAKGEFLALMGPSGSGKSTLLNLIAGIDKPTGGKITVHNRDVTSLNDGNLTEWRTRTIGFIFQFYNLIPVLTAYENVELPLLLFNMSKKDRNKRVMTALGAVGLLDRLDHYPRQLSGGQEQRVAIARAISTDPHILLADEPTGDLDAESAESIIELLQQLNNTFGKTIVLVTHDSRIAARAHKIKYLEKGVLTERKEE